MKFLWAVGVEGSGHHMVRALMKEFLNEPRVIDQGKWHPLFVNYFDPDKFDIKKISLVKKLIFKTRALDLLIDTKINKKIEDIIHDYSSDGVTHLFESASFPFGSVRETLRRFDLIEVMSLLNDLVDFRMLVLYRNPISSTYSGYRREFTKNLMLQAKIIEDNLIFINSQLKQLPIDTYRIVRFEDIIENPNLYVKPLSLWWDLDPSKLRIGMENIHTPTLLKNIPEDEKEFLERFFIEKKLEQWTSLHSPKKEVELRP